MNAEKNNGKFIYKQLMIIRGKEGGLRLAWVSKLSFGFRRLHVLGAPTGFPF